MSKTFKLVLLFLLMSFAGALCIFAEGGGRYLPYNLAVSPLCSFQLVHYTAFDFNDYTSFGPGVELSVERKVSDDLFLGFKASYELFNFEGLSKYRDLKTAATLKHQIVPKHNKESKIRLFSTMSAGTDFVVREDSSEGLYFLIDAGLNLAISFKDNSNVFIKANAGYTFQEGSNVIQASAGVGYSIAFGGSKNTRIEKSDVPEDSPDIGISILEPTETRRGFKCYIKNNILVCEILPPLGDHK